jgi:hypothetical protein
MKIGKYILQSIFLVISCLIFLFSAFALPWYLGYGSGFRAVAVCSLIMVSALLSIVCIIRSLRKSIIRDTGKSHAFRKISLGILVGIIIAAVQWLWNVSQYSVARRTPEIQPADVVEFLMAAILYGVLGFLGGLFIALRQVKK